jgi:hypothetical protein
MSTNPSIDFEHRIRISMLESRDMFLAVLAEWFHRKSSQERSEIITWVHLKLSVSHVSMDFENGHPSTEVS